MARKRNKLIVLAPISAVCDAAAIYLAMFAAFRLRFHSPFVLQRLPVTKGIPSVEIYLLGFAVGTLILLLLLRNAGFYTRPRLRRAGVEVLGLGRTVTFGYLIIMALAFSIRSTEFSRGVVAIAWATTIVVLGMERAAFNAIERWLYARHHGGIRVLLVGGGPAAERLTEGIRREPRSGYRIAGWIPIGDESGPDRVDALGRLDGLEAILARDRIHEVILCGGGLCHADTTALMDRCERALVGFRLVPDLFEILAARLELTSINGIPLLGAPEIPLDRIWNRALKRAFDLTGAAVGLALSAPICAIAAAWIRIDSPGPVFYRQQRLGENGHPFTLWKLRTMRIDAEADGNPGWTVDDDPRQTPAGRCLRRLNIDELPQFWNVLRGDMSLVGPRPERPHYVEQFMVDHDRYMSRHSALPGMTGWAQVNGLRGDTSIAERTKYDLYYLENWSLLLDLKILVLTVLSATRGS